MMKKNLALAAVLSLGMASGLQANRRAPIREEGCTFTFVNDGSKTVQIADKYNGNSSTVGVGQQVTLSPMRHHNLPHHRQFVIWVEKQDGSGQFEKKYIFKEKRCAYNNESKNVTFSEVIKFINDPSMRFETKEVGTMNDNDVSTRNHCARCHTYHVGRCGTCHTHGRTLCHTCHKSRTASCRTGHCGAYRHRNSQATVMAEEDTMDVAE
jgi:hypothetical protein